MATRRSSGLIVGFKGKIGPVVLTEWKGQEVIKTLPDCSKRAKMVITDELHQSQELFRIVTKFLSRVGREIFDLGYQVKKRDPYTSTNLACNYHIKHAVVGKYPDCKIDFSRLKFSKPKKEIEGGWNARFGSASERMLQVTWDRNDFPEKTTRLDDKPVIIFHSIMRDGFITHIGSGYQRSSLNVFYEWPKDYVGDEIHCWMFFVSADKKHVSETEYLGMVIVQE